MAHADPSVEWFGKIIVAFVALTAAMFLGYNQLSDQGIEFYHSSSQDYDVSFPPWKVNGTLANGTTVNSEGELTVNSSQGTYSYTTDVFDKNELIEISDFSYNADIREDQNQEILVKIYTSEDGFRTIENSQSFTLDDGTGSRVVDLPRSEDYRAQVLMSYSGTGQEPTLNSLKLEGNSYRVEQDYSIFIQLPFMLMLLLIAIFASIYSI